MGRNSTAPLCPERGTTLFCLLDIATCQFYFLLLDFWQQPFPFNILRTTVTINISLTPLLISLPDLEIIISVVSPNTENVPGFHHPAPFLVLLYPFILVSGVQNYKQYPGFGDGMKPILRVWDFPSPRFHGFSIGGTGQTRVPITHCDWSCDLLATAEMILLCLTT